jgi:hypothetical protein
MVEALDKLADGVLKADILPRGYNRSNLRKMVRAIGRRSLADTGPDFPTDAFGERQRTLG